MTEPVQRPREPRTLAEAVDPYIPRLMAGLMARDWKKAGGAVVAGAADYLATHDLSLGAGQALAMLRLGDDQRIVIAAILAAIEHEQLLSEPING